MNDASINILAHPDYRVSPGVGPIISYHGATFDLRRITIARAEEMARDSHHRYIQFSQERIQRDTQAALDAQRPSKNTGTGDRGGAANESGKDKKEKAA